MLCKNFSCICRAVPCPSPNSSRVSYHLSYRLCGSQLWRQPNAPNAQPPPDANRRWCQAEAKQHSVSGKKQLLFKSVFCAESDYSYHHLVELMNVRWHIYHYFWWTDNTPWARIGYNNIMVGTLDKMWCFSIDDVVDVALTCCQSFGPTTDSALVRRRGFSEVLSYFSDEIKTVATSRHPWKCLV